MCGRFSRDKDFSELKIRFRLAGAARSTANLFLRPEYNICPGAFQTIPSIVQESRRLLRLMGWGLVPSWAKDKRNSFRYKNARAETIMEMPIYKPLVSRRRCIIPATGYFEWRREEGQKLPYHFRLKDGQLFGLAGIWDLWKWPDGQSQDQYSFTIITTAPNDLVAKVHNRMPVILKEEDEDLWLDGGVRDSKEILSVLKTYPADEMECYPVSPRVNSSNFTGPECVEPLG